MGPWGRAMAWLSVPAAPWSSVVLGRLQHLGGAVALACALAAWECMGQLLQDIQREYSKPFFVVWTMHSGYISLVMVVLPMILMQYCCSGVGYSPPKGWLKCFLRASLINVLLLLADCVWCQSLPLTLMAANNAVYQSLGIFVYILSVLLLRESFTVDKTAAIILCVIGMCIVAFTTEIHGKIRSEPWGYGLALLSAFIFALYEVLFKLMDTDSRVQGGFPASRFPLLKHVLDTLVTVLLMGVSNLLLLWPIVLLANVTHIEVWEAPGDAALGRMVLNGVAGTLYAGSFLVGVALTTPFFMSMGLVFLVPLGYAVDLLRGNVRFEEIQPATLAGAGLVMIGFLVINLQMGPKRREEDDTIYLTLEPDGEEIQEPDGDEASVEEMAAIEPEVEQQRAIFELGDV
uniref:EamA domain-containing protein n=1 Tax=Eutreptiella gymnastica TaxID=73025 RepID=A0A7S4CXM0_9EUGL